MDYAAYRRKRLWRVVEITRNGTTTVKVRADTYEGAKERAAEIGLKNPTDIVLIKEATNG